MYSNTQLEDGFGQVNKRQYRMKAIFVMKQRSRPLDNALNLRIQDF